MDVDTESMTMAKNEIQWTRHIHRYLPTGYFLSVPDSVYSVARPPWLVNRIEGTIGCGDIDN